MLTNIYTKIRAFIKDWTKSSLETFYYQGSSIFTMTETNIASITSVTKNGVLVSSSSYTYNSTNNTLTFTIAMTTNDVIIVYYTYNKYSNTELLEYVRASLSYMSIYSDNSLDYEIDSSDIYPSLDKRTETFIAFIASILILPDYTEYRLPNITVRYNNKLTKEEKIRNEVHDFYRTLGLWTSIPFDEDLDDEYTE